MDWLANVVAHPKGGGRDGDGAQLPRWATSGAVAPQKGIPVATPFVGIPDCQGGGNGSDGSYGSYGSAGTTKSLAVVYPSTQPESRVAYLKHLVQVESYRNDILDRKHTYRILTLNLAFYYHMRHASSDERTRVQDEILPGTYSISTGMFNVVAHMNRMGQTSSDLPTVGYSSDIPVHTLDAAVKKCILGGDGVATLVKKVDALHSRWIIDPNIDFNDDFNDDGGGGTAKTSGCVKVASLCVLICVSLLLLLLQNVEYSS